MPWRATGHRGAGGIRTHGLGLICAPSNDRDPLWVVITYTGYVNSKAKGEISEGHVIARLLKMGYSVSIPFGNNQRYDLILDDGERLWRVQVKTARRCNGGVIFKTASVNGFTGVQTTYVGQIDLFLVYSPDLDKVYRIPIEACGASNFTLRTDPPKGGPMNTIKWAKDYEMLQVARAGFEPSDL
jgi:PD-(D/E)XK endonuclease